MNSLESELQEKTEEWHGTQEQLEELHRIDKARLKNQLADATAKKVLSILLALCIAY